MIPAETRTVYDQGSIFYARLSKGAGQCCCGSDIRVLMKFEKASSSVDPLGEALHFLRMSGIFYSRSEFSAPWGLLLPPMKDSLMFHFVTSGHCWLEVEGSERRQLQRGDLALVPHGEGHR